MRGIGIELAKSGDVLARDIINNRGDVLLRKGIELNDKYIKALKEESIKMIYLIDEIIPEEEFIDFEIISDTTRLDFVSAYFSLTKRVEKSKEAFFEMQPLDRAVNGVIDDIRSSRTTMVTNVGQYNDEITDYVHPLNVMIYSIVLGLKIGYNDFQIKDLAMAAALHDIGKFVPGDDRDHTVKGFEAIKVYSAVRSQAALQHHEKFDGTGYPNGVVGMNIHETSRIVAIANEFDILTFVNKDNERMPIFMAIERIQAMSGELDPLLVKTFVTQIALYPVGAFVRLNNHNYAVVTGYDKSTSSRPVVIEIGDRHANRLYMIKKRDLMKEKTLFITEIIPELDRDRLGLAR